MSWLIGIILALWFSFESHNQRSSLMLVSSFKHGDNSLLPSIPTHSIPVLWHNRFHFQLWDLLLSLYNQPAGCTIVITTVYSSLLPNFHSHFQTLHYSINLVVCKKNTNSFIKNYFLVDSVSNLPKTSNLEILLLKKLIFCRFSSFLLKSVDLETWQKKIFLNEKIFFLDKH